MLFYTGCRLHRAPGSSNIQSHGEWKLSCRRDRPDHWVHQRSDAFQLDFDFVAGADGGGAAGGAGEDQVAGVKRDVLAHEADDRGNAVDELAGAFILHNLAVELEAHSKVVVVQAGDDERSDRAERVASL